MAIEIENILPPKLVEIDRASCIWSMAKASNPCLYTASAMCLVVHFLEQPTDVFSLGKGEKLDQTVWRGDIQIKGGNMPKTTTM
jgi:hypothetical protein